MSCKHKCKCKKQPVLVLARLGDNNYQEFYDALTSDIQELYGFEFIEINFDIPELTNMVQKRLKCMCKKYGCKPDVVSALFNYTAEFQLASISEWFRKFYSTAFYSQQLEQMYKGRFKQFLLEVGEKIYWPEMEWNSSQRLQYALKPRPILGRSGTDIFYAKSLVARQNESWIIEEIEDPVDTFVTEYNRGIDVANYAGTTVSDRFVDQTMARGAQIRFSNPEMLNEMQIIQGGVRILTYAGNLGYPGLISVKNHLFTKVRGYALDSANMLVNSRFLIAAASFGLANR